MTLDEFDRMMEEQDAARREGGPPAFNPDGPDPFAAPAGPAAPAAPAVAAPQAQPGPQFMAAKPPGASERDVTGEAAFNQALQRRGGFNLPAGTDQRGFQTAPLVMVPGRYGPVAAGLSDASPFVHGPTAVAGDQARGLALLQQAEGSQGDAEKAFDLNAAKQQQQRQFEQAQATEAAKTAAQERWHTGDTQQRALDREATLQNQKAIAEDNRAARTASAQESGQARRDVADQATKARMLDQRDRIVESEFGAWRQSPEGKLATPAMVADKLAQLRQASEHSMAGTAAGQMAGLPPPVPVDTARQNRLMEAVRQGRLAYGLGGVDALGKPVQPQYTSEAATKFLDAIGRGFSPQEQGDVVQQVGAGADSRQLAESMIRAAARAQFQGGTSDPVGGNPIGSALFNPFNAAANKPVPMSGPAVPGLTVSSDSSALGRFGRTALGLGNQGNAYNRANYAGLTVPLDMADVGFNRTGNSPDEQSKLAARLMAAQQTLEFMRRAGMGGLAPQ